MRKDRLLKECVHSKLHIQRAAKSEKKEQSMALDERLFIYQERALRKSPSRRRRDRRVLLNRFYFRCQTEFVRLSTELNGPFQRLQSDRHTIQNSINEAQPPTQIKDWSCQQRIPNLPR